MAGIDLKLLQAEKRKNKRAISEEGRMKKQYSQNISYGDEELSTLFDSSSFEDDDTIEPMAECSTSSLKTKRARKDIITPRLAACLDRCKLSDRDAVHILTACVDALSFDSNEYTINRTSIKKSRETFRKEKFESIKKLDELKENFAVIHWDSKMLPDLTQRTNIDRLPVIVSSSSNFEQLLGVPGLASSKGVEVSAAVFDMVEDWGLTTMVQAFCFDTTASNTGRINGSAVLLEQKLGREILWLPCRHHIFELVLAGVFNSSKACIMSGPDVPLFKRFKSAWESIDKSKYSDFKSDSVLYDVLKGHTEEIIEFAKNSLKELQPRDDYKELLNLTLIFLGEKIEVFEHPALTITLDGWLKPSIA